VRDDLNGVSKIIRVDRVTGRPLFHLVQRAAAVLEDLVVDDVDLTGGRQGRDQAGDTVHDQARLTLAFEQGLFCSFSFRNLLLQSLVGCGKFDGTLRHALVECTGDSPLLSQEARLSQPDACLIRSNVQKEPVGCIGKVDPVRASDDDADLGVLAQCHGGNGKIHVADGDACT
jgi:hypothetical protein